MYPRERVRQAAGKERLPAKAGSGRCRPSPAVSDVPEQVT